MNVYKIYKFYDSDITGTNVLDITGNDYKELIKICCENSIILSLIITNPNSELLNKLEKFQIPKNSKITYTFEHYDRNNLKIQYYQVTSELCKIILENTYSIFSWINGWGYNNPEDPTFYRGDGSVFFTSTIHEGECTLFIRDEKVCLNSYWRKQDKR